MRVILNSDILYSDQLVVSQPSSRLRRLFDECARRGHVIVIPLTTLLEYQRKQCEARDQVINRLHQAFDRLSRHGIGYESVDLDEQIKRPDLVQMIRACGVKVDVVQPTIEDFSEAHRRTCLHQPPHAPTGDTCEMRDLVIWMIALRLARQHGNAILISRDEVHKDERGDAEALAAGLQRFTTIEKALNYFAGYSLVAPAGKRMKQLISSVWDDLRDAGLPITLQVSLADIQQPRFVKAQRGISRAKCSFTARTQDDKELQCFLDMHIADDTIVQVDLSSISLGGAPWKQGILQVKPDEQLHYDPDEYEERLADLREIIGGQS